jgi:hypothetical protein
MYLGNAVAQYAASHYFQAVLEPGTSVLPLLGVVALAVPMRKRIR